MTKHSDIPFAQDSSRFFLPWISMLMIFIASLTLSGGITAYRALSYWNDSVSGSMTIQIPVVTPNGQQRNDSELAVDLERALTVVRTNPGIIGAHPLEGEQMKRLMAPWLGADTDITTLPLPKVIDITVDPKNPPQIQQLKNDLAEQVPTAILDTHRIWLDNLITMAQGFMKLTLFILILLLVTTAFTVVYCAQTSLRVHKKVVRLVHMMGANDWYIAWQYGRRIFKLALLGGIGGLALALPIILGVGYFFETIAVDFNCSLNAASLTLLVLTPLLFALLAFITTLKTVLSSLKRML